MEIRLHSSSGDLKRYGRILECFGKGAQDILSISGKESVIIELETLSQLFNALNAYKCDIVADFEFIIGVTDENKYYIEIYDDYR
ncbi:hypothetical protein BC351_00895 [Paenibacillus ferrarius]|uniref:Uncharacterized protein n=1 Tax=Paenibacillus ferrarius TaxID=1469647 RepID=A0A1V4HSA4_9BACL|nr:hypothetical protein [Paenibacillus ferrarius]OPH61829.1 hypothetical protein BC351_00895 [Paenibacillus ferrarius]